jgi:hypothetical protein
MLICDLIDAIKPGSIQYNLLKTSATTEVKIEFLYLPNFFVCLYLGKNG